MINENKVKSALKLGKTVIGSEASRFGITDLVHIFAQAGFDFIFIDMEHTTFNLETVAQMIQVSRLLDITPIVRVPDAKYHLVARVMDVGAQGIMIPRVNTPKQVEEIVSWLRYPPDGIRGYAQTSHQTNYKSLPAEDFIAAIEKETLLLIQIERKVALGHLDEMLSIPGIDVAVLGIMDLSVDLGIPGQINHPLMTQSIEKIVSVSQQYGISSGIIAGDLEFVADWGRKGMSFLSYATGERILFDSAAKSVQQLRISIKPPEDL